MNKKHLKIIIAVIIGILLFGFLYFSFFGNRQGESELLINIDANDPTFFAGGNQLLPLVLKLRNIDFDAAALSSPAFSSLSDFSVSIEPQPRGRINPFAPIGTDEPPVVVLPSGGEPDREVRPAAERPTERPTGASNPER